MNNRYYSSLIGGVASIALLTVLAPATFAVNTYLGVSGGVSQLSVSDDSSYFYGDMESGTNYATTVSDSSSGSSIGGTGEVYVGMFLQPISSLYLGSEINLTGFTGSANTTVADTINLRGATSYDSGLSPAIGFSLMPGWVLNNKTILYSRLGIDYAKFTSTIADDNANTFASSTINQNELAYRLGLGLDHYITSNLSLRLEGDYWQGSQASITDSYVYSPNLPQDTLVQLTQKFTPHVMTGSVGLTYHFGE